MFVRRIQQPASTIRNIPCVMALFTDLFDAYFVSYTNLLATERRIFRKLLGGEQISQEFGGRLVPYYLLSSIGRSHRELICD